MTLPRRLSAKCSPASTDSLWAPRAKQTRPAKAQDCLWAAQLDAPLNWSAERAPNSTSTQRAIATTATSQKKVSQVLLPKLLPHTTSPSKKVNSLSSSQSRAHSLPLSSKGQPLHFRRPKAALGNHKGLPIGACLQRQGSLCVPSSPARKGGLSSSAWPLSQSARLAAKIGPPLEATYDERPHDEPPHKQPPRAQVPPELAPKQLNGQAAQWPASGSDNRKLMIVIMTTSTPAEQEGPRMATIFRSHWPISSGSSSTLALWPPKSSSNACRRGGQSPVRAERDKASGPQRLDWARLGCVWPA